MTFSTENATSPKSATFNHCLKSRNSESSVSRGTNSNRDFGWARGGGGALAPQLPRAISAGPNACGEKSGGLYIYPRNCAKICFHPHLTLP